MDKLREDLDEIVNNPVKVDDKEFDDKVARVRQEVEDLWEKARDKLRKFSAKIISWF